MDRTNSSSGSDTSRDSGARQGSSDGRNPGQNRNQGSKDGRQDTPQGGADVRFDASSELRDDIQGSSSSDSRRSNSDRGNQGR